MKNIVTKAVRTADLRRRAVRPDRSRRALSLGLMTMLLMSLVLPAAAPAEPSSREQKRKPKTAAERVALADAGGGEKKISGWATFSGQHMGANDDPKDDAEPQVLAEAEGAEAIGSDFIYRPENEDFFWRFEVTKIPTTGVPLGGVATAGSLEVLYVLKLSINKVDYQIRVHRFPSVDPDNPLGNAFGLFKCDEASGPACMLVAPLKGGYGTTGERIVVALPLSVLKEEDNNNVKEGDIVGGLAAYSWLGDFLLGPLGESFLDEVRLIKTATVPIPEKSVHVTVGKVTRLADLKDGYFDASFPAKLFRKPTTTVKTKTCLGKECVKQSFKVKN
jgi:hypothetical protein